ncbi:ABC transporter substrate-binding protein [Bacillus sp. UMB0899]|nr:ABC transporter substrate-binding protein [Bacillus sp. UMB0899]
MKRVKVLLFSFMVVSLVWVLGACNNKENTTSNAEEGKKVLEVWSRDNVAALLETPVNEFNKTNNDVEVKITPIPADKFAEQYATALKSGNTPDVVTLDLIYAPYFASVGAFKDITEKYNSMPYKDQLVEGMMKLGNYQEKQYAVPLSADVSALIYNKEHFREVGLDPEKPPVTWSELREYAKKLTTDGRYGYTYAAGAPGTLMFTFLPYVWGNDGDITNDDGTKALIGNEQSIEALKFMTDLTQKDKVVPPGAPTYQGQNAYDTFTSGKASMIVYGNFKVSDLNLNFPDIDYGVALVPKKEGTEHSSFIGGDLVAVSADTDKEDEAIKFIDFILSEEVQVEFFAKNGTIPVRKDFFDNKYFQDEPRYQVFTEALNLGKTPYSTKHNEILNIWNTTQQALMGEKTPEEVFKNQQQEIQKLLDSK